MSEIAGQDTSLTTVKRSMATREIAAGPARAAVLKRRYDAPVEDVWDAITTPDRVDRFFLPLSGDLREGGLVRAGRARPAARSWSATPRGCCGCSGPRPTSAATATRSRSG